MLRTRKISKRVISALLATFAVIPLSCGRLVKGHDSELIVDTLPVGIIQSNPRVRLVVDSSSTLYPLTAVPVLDSLPGAAATLYLDFDGHFEAQWGSFSNATTPPFDLDGDYATFSASELEAIDLIWKYISEDFAPFKINVTTVLPPSFGYRDALRVSIGGDGAWYGQGASGVAYENCFTNSRPNTVFAFSENVSGQVKTMANTASHEAGHGFGLGHQIGIKIEHGPIMGGGLRQVWWLGINTDDILQDDMAIIGRMEGINVAVNGFGYRPDDHGDSAAEATSLSEEISTNGIIATTSDVDYFSFSTDGGLVTLTATVPTEVNNLDTILELRDESGSTLIASADPSLPTNLYAQDLTPFYGATITKNLAAGSYTAVVRSHGTYGDVGQYSIRFSNTEPPDTSSLTVNLTAPANGTTVPRNALVPITASVQPAIGIAKVKFFVNGNLKCTVLHAPYTCDWKTGTLANKTYNLKAKAIDSVGNVVQSGTVVVTSVR